jgi:hypothetical protein
MMKVTSSSRVSRSTVMTGTGKARGSPETGSRMTSVGRSMSWLNCSVGRPASTSFGSGTSEIFM